MHACVYMCKNVLVEARSGCWTFLVLELQAIEFSVCVLGSQIQFFVRTANALNHSDFLRYY